MSVNTAHASNGVLIHAGEYILLHSDSVSMEFSGSDNSIFKGSKQGRIYLTSHRIIFNNKKPGDDMQSFSAPFIAMSDVEIEQPVFGANYIKGKVRAQPNGNFVGEVKFKIYFKGGGAIEYGQALLRAATTAQSNLHRHGGTGGYDDPPPYTPSGNWHEAPPPAYQPPPGYYGWLPTHDAFRNPAPNTVFMSDNPPPYPGIMAPPAYTSVTPQAMGMYPAPPYSPPQQQQQGWQPMPPQQQPQQPYQQQPGFNPYYNQQQQQQQPPSYGPTQHQQQQNQPPQQQQQQTQHEEISWNGFSLPPPEEPQRREAGGMVNAAPYPYAGPSGSSGNGALGFSAPSANSKEAEAMASAYNTTYNQRGNNAAPSDMPPSYDDLPPNYEHSTRKNQ